MEKENALWENQKVSEGSLSRIGTAKGMRNHLWIHGDGSCTHVYFNSSKYAVSTVEFELDKIKDYIAHQEKLDSEQEEGRF